MSDKLVRIKNRYDTHKNWYKENPILAAGEIGINSINHWIKIGDGSTDWNDLNYSGTHQIIINNGVVDESSK